MKHPANFVLVTALILGLVSLIFSAAAVAGEIQFYLDKRFSQKPIGKVRHAEVLQEGNKFIISVDLERSARELLAQLTNKHRGEWIYMRVEEHVLFSGVLPEPILDGTFLVDGEFTKQEAEEIVKAIMGSDPA